jgi:hypothetical protein
MRKVLIIPAAVFVLALIFVLTSGSFLVVNHPERADVIVVLAGEQYRRPALALALLSQGYAPKILIDVPATNTIFGHNLLQLAQEYVRSLPQSQAVDLCPIVGLSTKAETEDVARCLPQLHAHKVLLVTSNYHTRRSLSIFRRQLPQYDFSVAAALDRQQFDPAWWRQRQWAKLNFDEWTRLVWWEMVDRWR